jgi:integrase
VYFYTRIKGGAMKLTDTAVRKSKPEAKPYKMTDGGGMHLFVHSNGGKYWRMAYRFAGKHKTLALGVYPDVGLADARQRREDARKLLANDVDPGAVKQAQKAASTERAANSFEVIALEWHTKFSAGWAASTTYKIKSLFERDVFPWIGSRPIAEITSPELLAVLRRIEKRTVDTAYRAQQECSKVFRYAIATGRAERNPCPDLKGALSPNVAGHFAAITDPKRAGELLRAIDNYRGSFVTMSALRLAPLLLVRPGELRKAVWAEIDLDKSEWCIPAERMKMKLSHLVPLCSQAVAILRELHQLTGQGRYVFPSVRSNDRTMSDNTILVALRIMGFASDEMTGHGFRAMARTILDEVLGVRPDFIEHQLAHAVKDPNGRAYNRTAHLVERRKMMQLWADYLDKLKTGADVIPLRAKG